MLKSFSENQWLRQAAVFVAYITAYLLLRPYSNGIWAITSGLRLSCLLFLPYRYWPTLVLAEVGPLAYANYACLEQFGLLWTITNSIPPLLYAMPVVWWCRHHLAMFPSRRMVRGKALLICIVLASLVWTATSLAVLLTVKQPPTVAHPYHFHGLEAIQLFLGRYAGVLTVLPIALALKLQKSEPWRVRLAEWARSQLALECAVLLLPTLAVLYWFNHRVSADGQQVIRMAMFLPVAWLTMKHGWRAAAIGIAAALCCIFLDMASLSNLLGVAGVQAFVTFTATSLFALGARVTLQRAVEEQEHLDAKAAIKVAQQGVYHCELRMRQAAQTLEQLGGTLQLTQSRLLNRFKHMLPLTEGQAYYKQMATTQGQVYQLAESLHPTAWRERGLPAALRETIGRSLDEAGVGYRFELKGRGLSQLSPGVHAAIYRLACEAVVYAYARQPWSTIIISLRGGLTHGQRWASLRVEGNADDMACITPRRQESQQLAVKLGANSLGIMAMRDYARLYNGELHTFTKPDSFRITALVHDVSQRAQEPLAEAPVSVELYIR